MDPQQRQQLELPRSRQADPGELVARLLGLSKRPQQRAEEATQAILLVVLVQMHQLLVGQALARVSLTHPWWLEGSRQVPLPLQGHQLLVAHLLALQSSTYPCWQVRSKQPSLSPGRHQLPVAYQLVLESLTRPQSP